MKTTTFTFLAIFLAGCVRQDDDGQINKEYLIELSPPHQQSFNIEKVMDDCVANRNKLNSQDTLYQ